MNITPRIQDAIDFFRAAHDSIAQKRKYSGEPYWKHTEEVAGLVDEVMPGEENVIIAALGHDFAEDVLPKHPGYSMMDIEMKFGTDVNCLIMALTDVYTSEKHPELNRNQRKELERLRLAEVSSDAQTIKLADIISNTNDITKHDPDFAKRYLIEKLWLLPLLRNGNETLYLRAYNQLSTILKDKRWEVRIKELPPVLTEEEANSVLTPPK